MKTRGNMKRLSFLVCLLLAGCGEPQRYPEPDQCLRREIFKECMASLPKGPQSVHNSNDWDEVVDACESAAAYQSKRAPEQIKPECRMYK